MVVGGREGGGDVRDEASRGRVEDAEWWCRSDLGESGSCDLEVGGKKILNQLSGIEEETAEEEGRITMCIVQQSFV